MHRYNGWCTSASLRVSSCLSLFRMSILRMNPSALASTPRLNAYSECQYYLHAGRNFEIGNVLWSPLPPWCQRSSNVCLQKISARLNRLNRRLLAQFMDWKHQLSLTGLPSLPSALKIMHSVLIGVAYNRHRAFWGNNITHGPRCMQFLTKAQLPWSTPLLFCNFGALEELHNDQNRNLESFWGGTGVVCVFICVCLWHEWVT